jgi:sulfate adenylyltransferase subunit 1 (EFTu-like GTPase family)
MEIINNNMNIKKMYKYQLENLEKEEYQNYINYLDIFFKKEFKKEKYNKEYLDGKYILIDKMLNPSSYKKLYFIP